MADGEDAAIQVVSTISGPTPGNPAQPPDSEMDALLLGRTRVSELAIKAQQHKFWNHFETLN